MPTPALVRSSVQTEDGMTPRLTDAYLHIQVHVESWHLRRVLPERSDVSVHGPPIRPTPSATLVHAWPSFGSHTTAQEFSGCELLFGRLAGKKSQPADGVTIDRTNKKLFYAVGFLDKYEKIRINSNAKASSKNFITLITIKWLPSKQKAC